MLLSLVFEGNTFSGVLGKSQMLYWSAHSINRFFGYEDNHPLENTHCITTVVAESQLESYKLGFLRLKVMLHETFMELLRKSKLKSAQLLSELFSQDAFYVTETSIDFYSVVLLKVCPENTPLSINFYEWLEQFKNEVSLHGSTSSAVPPPNCPPQILMETLLEELNSPPDIPVEPLREEPDSPPYVPVEPFLDDPTDMLYVPVEPADMPHTLEEMGNSPTPPVAPIHSPPTSPERSPSPCSLSLPPSELTQEPLDKNRKWMQYYDGFPPTKITWVINGEKLDYYRKYS